MCCGNGGTSIAGFHGVNGACGGNTECAVLRKVEAIGRERVVEEEPVGGDVLTKRDGGACIAWIDCVGATSASCSFRWCRGGGREAGSSIAMIIMSDSARIRCWDMKRYGKSPTQSKWGMPAGSSTGIPYIHTEM